MPLPRRTPVICVATGTRADWGLLRPVAAALRASGNAEVKILATNMHLLDRFGHTASEIEADGFEIDASVPMPAGDSPADRARAMGVCLSGTASALEKMQPDAIIILGDRYEMLAVASAAALMGVPIIHIAGGEVSEGAIDDSLRHAISKLSTLHLTATEDYRRRVIQLGEAPDRVINTGAIGVWNIANAPRMSRAELLAPLGLDPAKPFAVVTYHPATLDADAAPVERFDALLEALDRFPELNIILTYPNNDPRSAAIIDRIEAYAAAHPERVAAVPSLGMRRYLPAITEAAVVIGNSSSGIVEVPSAGTPTVDIGMRQRGRIAAESVIHCDEGTEAIAQAIARALSAPMQTLAGRRDNPYHKPDTLALMTDTILRFVESLPCAPKKFYDLTC